MNRDTRRTRLLLALLLLTSITLVALDHRGQGKSPLDGLRSIGAAVFGPVERAASAIARPVSSAVDDLSSVGRNTDKAAELGKTNATLRQQLRTSELARNRAAELDALLRTAGAGRYRVVPAQVVAVGAAQSFSWTVTIDAGSRDGIKPDMTVINGDGLVGRVKTVGPTTATVLLAIDPQSAVGVRLEKSMEVGITSGQGAAHHGELSLELLDGQSSVVTGDRLVSFGSRGSTPYVPGVPVGEVVGVQKTVGTLTRIAAVRPYVDFTSLDLVAVVVEPPRTDPRDAVLPPPPARPKPIPTVTVTVTAKPAPTPTKKR
ncbi:MAG: rod shape-determining protein MreC [Actinomycetota bacterium]|jgi:rod shape-determining protein MreC|nr:rod shape-determining protein MreC [Actinomycetota bacterium]